MLALLRGQVGEGQHAAVPAQPSQPARSACCVHACPQPPPEAEGLAPSRGPALTSVRPKCGPPHREEHWRSWVLHGAPRSLDARGWGMWATAAATACSMASGSQRRAESCWRWPAVSGRGAPCGAGNTMPSCLPAATRLANVGWRVCTRAAPSVPTLPHTYTPDPRRGAGRLRLSPGGSSRPSSAASISSCRGPSTWRTLAQ